VLKIALIKRSKAVAKELNLNIQYNNGILRLIVTPEKTNGNFKHVSLSAEFTQRELI
jgi:hypothetical protein